MNNCSFFHSRTPEGICRAKEEPADSEEVCQECPRQQDPREGRRKTKNIRRNCRLEEEAQGRRQKVETLTTMTSKTFLTSKAESGKEMVKAKREGKGTGGRVGDGRVEGVFGTHKRPPV